MPQDFILHIQVASGSADNMDAVLLGIMDREGMAGAIQHRHVGIVIPEVYYHVRMERATLVRLKELMEAAMTFKLFELFEYRDW